MRMWRIVASTVAAVTGMWFTVPPILRGMHRLLVVHRPVGAPALIIEGWLFPSMLREAAACVNQGRYSILIVTGTPLSDSNSTADRAISSLSQLGVNTTKAFRVSVPTNHKRTLSTAQAVKVFLGKEHPEVKSVDIFTGGAHSRKTLTAYRRVMGDQILVGVIPSTIQHYDPNRWWMSRRGIYGFFRMSVGYLYVRFTTLPQA